MRARNGRWKYHDSSLLNRNRILDFSYPIREFPLVTWQKPRLVDSCNVALVLDVWLLDRPGAELWKTLEARVLRLLCQSSRVPVSYAGFGFFQQSVDLVIGQVFVIGKRCRDFLQSVKMRWHDRFDPGWIAGKVRSSMRGMVGWKFSVGSGEIPVRGSASFF